MDESDTNSDAGEKQNRPTLSKESKQSLDDNETDLKKYEGGISSSERRSGASDYQKSTDQESNDKGKGIGNAETFDQTPDKDQNSQQIVEENLRDSVVISCPDEMNSVAQKHQTLSFIVSNPPPTPSASEPDPYPSSTDPSREPEEGLDNLYRSYYIGIPVLGDPGPSSSLQRDEDLRGILGFSSSMQQEPYSSMVPNDENLRFEDLLYGEDLEMHDVAEEDNFLEPRSADKGKGREVMVIEDGNSTLDSQDKLPSEREICKKKGREDVAMNTANQRDNDFLFLGESTQPSIDRIPSRVEYMTEDEQVQWALRASMRDSYEPGPSRQNPSHDAPKRTPSIPLEEHDKWLDDDSVDYVDNLTSDNNPEMDYELFDAQVTATPIFPEQTLSRRERMKRNQILFQGPKSPHKSSEDLLSIHTTELSSISGEAMEDQEVVPREEIQKIEDAHIQEAQRRSQLELVTSRHPGESSRDSRGSNSRGNLILGTSSSRSTSKDCRNRAEEYSKLARSMQLEDGTIHPGSSILEIRKCQKPRTTAPIHHIPHIEEHIRKNRSLRPLTQLNPMAPMREPSDQKFSLNKFSGITESTTLGREDTRRSKSLADSHMLSNDLVSGPSMGIKDITTPRSILKNSATTRSFNIQSTSEDVGESEHIENVDALSQPPSNPRLSHSLLQRSLTAVTSEPTQSQDTRTNIDGIPAIQELEDFIDGSNPSLGQLTDNSALLQDLQSQGSEESRLVIPSARQNLNSVIRTTRNTRQRRRQPSKITTSKSATEAVAKRESHWKFPKGIIKSTIDVSPRAREKRRFATVLPRTNLYCSQTVDGIEEVSTRMPAQQVLTSPNQYDHSAYVSYSKYNNGLSQNTYKTSHRDFCHPLSESWMALCDSGDIEDEKRMTQDILDELNVLVHRSKASLRDKTSSEDSTEIIDARSFLLELYQRTGFDMSEVDLEVSLNDHLATPIRHLLLMTNWNIVGAAVARFCTNEVSYILDEDLPVGFKMRGFHKSITMANWLRKIQEIRAIDRMTKTYWGFVDCGVDEDSKSCESLDTKDSFMERTSKYENRVVFAPLKKPIVYSGTEKRPGVMKLAPKSGGFELSLFRVKAFGANSFAAVNYANLKSRLSTRSYRQPSMPQNPENQGSVAMETYDTSIDIPMPDASPVSTDHNPATHNRELFLVDSGSDNFEDLAPTEEPFFYPSNDPDNRKDLSQAGSNSFSAGKHGDRSRQRLLPKVSEAHLQHKLGEIHQKATESEPGSSSLRSNISILTRSSPDTSNLNSPLATNIQEFWKETSILRDLLQAIFMAPEEDVSAVVDRIKTSENLENDLKAMLKQNQSAIKIKENQDNGKSQEDQETRSVVTRFIHKSPEGRMRGLAESPAKEKTSTPELSRILSEPLRESPEQLSVSPVARPFSMDIDQSSPLSESESTSEDTGHQEETSATEGRVQPHHSILKNIFPKHNKFIEELPNRLAAIDVFRKRLEDKLREIGTSNKGLFLQAHQESREFVMLKPRSSIQFNTEQPCHSYEEDSSLDEDYPSREETAANVRRMHPRESGTSSSISPKPPPLYPPFDESSTSKNDSPDTGGQSYIRGTEPAITERIARRVAQYCKAKDIPAIVPKESENSTGQKVSQHERSQGDEDTVMPDVSQTNIGPQSRNDLHRHNVSADIALPSIENGGMGHIPTPFQKRRGPMLYEYDDDDSGSPKKRRRMMLRNESSSGG